MKRYKNFLMQYEWFKLAEPIFLSEKRFATEDVGATPLGRKCALPEA